MNDTSHLLRLLCHLLRVLSVATLGVFAGAMLTEGFVLVPYWRSLPAEEFFRWYAANDLRLLGFFGPITAAAGVTIVAAATTSLWEGCPGRWQSAVAAVLTIAAIVTFPAYFQAANASFAAASIPATELAAELARWSMWHDARTVLSLAALAAATISL